MKKLFSFLALSCIGLGASAQTVIARMGNLVDAGTNHGATVSQDWTASESNVYQFSNNAYIGGITSDGVAEAFEGDKYVTVAMYVYGNSLSGCPFGYGEGSNGLKYMLSGTTAKITTKGVKDFEAKALGNMGAQEWNLVAFTVPGKSKTTATQSKYISPAGVYTVNQTLLTDAGMAIPTSKKFAIGSGDHNSAREPFEGLLANVTVIQSDDFLTLDEVKDQIGNAPTFNVQLTTNEANPILYTIASYDRGGVLTANGTGAGVTHVAENDHSFWYFTAADGNTTNNVAGGVIAHNYDGTALTTSWQTAAEGGVVYILPNGVNDKGLSISKTNTITSGSCIDAKNQGNTGVGDWNPSAGDWQGTTWVFARKTLADYTAAVEGTKMYHPVSRVATLDGTYMIYNGCYNNTEDRTGFMKSNNGNIAHVGTHDKPLTYQANYACLFDIHPVDGVENGYTIFSVKDQCYIGVNGQKSATAATIYIQPWATSTHTKPDGASHMSNNFGENSDDATGYWTVGASATGNSGNNMWNGNPATFALWSNSHPWAFYEICRVDESGITEAMINNAKAYAQHKVGQNVDWAGGYGLETFATMTSVNTLSEGATFSEYVTAINGINETTLHTPALGSFIRIKGVSNKYISGSATSGRIPMTDNADDAVLWYSYDGKLIGYKSGYGFKETYNVAELSDTKETHTFNAGTTGSEKLQIVSSSESKYLYDGTTEVNRNTTPANQTNWVITDVTELPVNMVNVAGGYYASLHLPVAVTLPAGVKAYSGEVSGDELVLTGVVAGGNLAAYTPVVLYSANAVTESFAIANSGTSAGTSDLAGTTEALSAAEGQVGHGAYVLNKSGDNVGFYKTTTKINGFKAYLGAGAVSSSNALSFRFDDVVTAIDAVENANTTAEIFDINGRRLNKAQKGLNIINGMKVLVK